MSTLVALGLLIGLDNLRFGIGLGALDTGNRRRWQLALSFGLFEALMPLAGVLVGSMLIGALEIDLDWLGPALLAACGLLVLWGAVRRADARKRIAGSSWLFAFPLILSIDNLLAGGALAAMDVPLVPAACFVGVLSAGLAFVGLYCGSALVRYIPARGDVVAGAVIVVVSLVGLVPIL